MGFLLGLAMAYAFYRTIYAGLMSPDAGVLVAGAPLAVDPTATGGRRRWHRNSSANGAELNTLMGGDEKV